MLPPLVTPFTTTGIVVIFLIFFLFQRIFETASYGWLVAKIWSEPRPHLMTPGGAWAGFS
jgi:hypothetical protein